MSSYFLQREGHRIFVLSTIKIKEGATGGQGALFLYSKKEASLTLSALEYPVCGALCERDVKFHAPGLKPVSDCQRSRTQRGRCYFWPLQDSFCLLQRLQRGAGSCQEQGTTLGRLALSQSGTSADPKMKVQRW